MSTTKKGPVRYADSSVTVFNVYIDILMHNEETGQTEVKHTFVYGINFVLNVDAFRGLTALKLVKKNRGRCRVCVYSGTHPPHILCSAKIPRMRGLKYLKVVLKSLQGF